MINIEKMSQTVKVIAENAESLFQLAKDRFDIADDEDLDHTDKDTPSKAGSTTDKINDKITDKIKDQISSKLEDSHQLLQMAEQMLSQVIDPLVADYLKRHIAFHSKVKVKIKTLPHFKGSIPKYESDGASGLDVRAQLSGSIIIKPFERVLVPTGLSMEVPIEYEIQARPRSGLSLKKGLTLVNTPGTIDADYRGEIKMIMINLGQEDVQIEDQDRIAQLVIAPVVKAQFVFSDELSNTERGNSGFGSTGAK